MPPVARKISFCPKKWKNMVCPGLRESISGQGKFPSFRNPKYAIRVTGHGVGRFLLA